MVHLVFFVDQWKPLNLEEKKRYDREFLLGFQFIFASMQKPEGLPHISDVVLDKVGRLEGEGLFGLAGWLAGWGRGLRSQRVVRSHSLFLTPSLSPLQANKTPLRSMDPPTKLQGINCGPDFTPSFANLGRPALSNRGPPRGGPGGELPRGPVSGIGLEGQMVKGGEGMAPLSC